MPSIESSLHTSTLIELARARAARQPRRRAFTFLRNGEAPTAHLTYAELDAHARRIATTLQRRFCPGDRVLLACSSAFEFVPAFFGCLYAGVVAVLVDPPASTTEIARLKRIASDSGAVGLCTGTHGFNIGHLRLAAPELPRELTCVATTECAPATDWVDPGIDPDDLAFVQYTGSAHRAPRGVMVSHANVLHNQRLIESALQSNRHTRPVGWLSPHHDMGLIGHVVQPLYLGVTSVLMSPGAFIAKPARWLQAITQFGATVSGGPASAYELCVRRVTGDEMRTLDLRRWKVAYAGSEPVRVEALERFANRFAACGFRRDAFVACYGSTEATLLVSASRRSSFPSVRAIDADELQQHRVRTAGTGSRNIRRVVGCGRPSAQSVVIVDPETRTACPAGCVGEIWINGHSVAVGYWNNVPATQATFRARLAAAVDGDGGDVPYLRTGDLGFVCDGELHVTGQVADLLRIAGRHYYAGDIEDTVRASHPAFRNRDAAAFAVDSTSDSRLVVVQELEQRGWRRLRHADLANAARSALRFGYGLDTLELIFLPEGRLPKAPDRRTRRFVLRDAYLADGLASAVHERHSVAR